MSTDLKPTWRGLDDEVKIRVTTKQKRRYQKAASDAKVEFSAWARAVLDAAADAS